MSYYILTAIVALAASKSKVQVKANQTDNDGKINSGGQKVVAKNQSKGVPR